MKNVTDLRQVFRIINEALQNLHGMETGERDKTIQALVTINEKLADETESLLKKAIIYKKHSDAKQ